MRNYYISGDDKIADLPSLVVRFALMSKSLCETMITHCEARSDLFENLNQKTSEMVEKFPDEYLFKYLDQIINDTLIKEKKPNE